MALFSTNCGGGGSPASLRLLQASPDAPPVNVLIDGKSVAVNLAYGNDTGYLSVNSGSRHVQVVPASGGSPIFDQTISLVSNTNQTLLLTGPAAAIQPVRLDDTAPTIVANSGYVRVVNASATMGAADAYLVPAGTSIVGVKPVAAGMTFDQNTGYQVIVAGSYQVFMTTPGTATALLSTGPLSLTLSQNQTVVSLDGVPGGFTYVRLTDQ
jgi:Domain of unknown function (DUF4397)